MITRLLHFNGHKFDLITRSSEPQGKLYIMAHAGPINISPRQEAGLPVDLRMFFSTPIQLCFYCRDGERLELNSMELIGGASTQGQVVEVVNPNGRVRNLRIQLLGVRNAEGGFHTIQETVGMIGASLDQRWNELIFQRLKTMIVDLLSGNSVSPMEDISVLVPRDETTLASAIEIVARRYNFESVHFLGCRGYGINPDMI